MRYAFSIGFLMLLAVVGAWLGAPVLEQRVRDNVESALLAEGIDEVVVEIDGRDVTLTGGVVNLERKELAERTAAGAIGVGRLLSRLGVSTLEAAPEIEPPDEPVPAPTSSREGCQQELDGLLAAGRIDFESSRAEIQETSLPLLDALSEVLGRCGEARVEVAGHTDASGPREENLELSLRRAESVVEYLVGTGIATERLTAVGHGPDRPLVDNGTVEGRAHNRRIEFHVQHPAP